MIATLNQARNPGKRLFRTLSTATSFSAKIPTTTEPTPALTNGIIKCDGQNMVTMFIATGADNVTGKAQLFGWSRVVDMANGILWVPTPLEVLIDFTASAVVGVASSPVIATERFADVVTKTTGRSASIAITATSDLGAGCLICDCAGFEYMEWLVHNNSSATAVGCIVRFF